MLLAGKLAMSFCGWVAKLARHVLNLPATYIYMYNIMNIWQVLTIPIVHWNNGSTICIILNLWNNLNPYLLSSLTFDIMSPLSSPAVWPSKINTHHLSSWWIDRRSSQNLERHFDNWIKKQLREAKATLLKDKCIPLLQPFKQKY